MIEKNVDVDRERLLVGLLSGITEPIHVRMNACRTPRIFEYVVIASEDVLNNTQEEYLAFVENARTASSAFSNPSFIGDGGIPNFETMKEFADAGSVDSRDKGYEATLRIVGKLNELFKNDVVLSTIAPDPASKVYEAPKNTLQQLFSPRGEDDEFWRMGVLASNPDIEVSFDFNAVTNFRLGIFGITRYGKTNVALSCVKYYAYHDATMVIFDIKGDYSTLNNTDYNNNLNVVDARISLSQLSADEFCELLSISETYHNQVAVLHKVFTDDIKRLDEFKFSRRLFAEIQTVSEDKDNKTLAKAASGLLYSLGPKLSRLSKVVAFGDDDTINEIKADKINIIRLNNLKPKQLDKAAAYYLRELYERRTAIMNVDADNAHKDMSNIDGQFPAPIVILLEEAQNYIPASGVDKISGNKKTAEHVINIAKMGASDGLGLIVVSQQPNKINEEVMSQLNSKVVMRLVNEHDQTAIFKSSESLSEDLVDHFPNFNKGIGLAVGPIVRMPTIIKFDEVKNRKRGATLNPARMWNERKKEKLRIQRELEEQTRIEKLHR